MKITIMKAVPALLAIVISNAAVANEVINWDAKIKWVNVNTDKVYFFLHPPTNPAPVSSFTCDYGMININSNIDPLHYSLLFSLAVQAYKSQANVRIGIKGSGTNCEVEYISIR